MTILGSEPVTLIRTAVGTRNAEGYWVPGVTTTTTVYLAIQPGGKTTKFESSGHRYSAVRTFLTTDKLRPVSQFGQTDADIIRFVDDDAGESDWRVIDTRELRAILPHYEGLIGMLEDPQDP